MPSHSRRPSAGAGAGAGPDHHTNNASQHHNHHHQTSPSKHQRTHTAPATPSLLRLPSSTSSAGASTSPRTRRATNPSTPTLTPSQLSTSSATSSSYFSPQAAASGKEARSPATRRPPASFSAHGIDNSRGPPITLITRGTVDIARRSQQKSTDFAFAQQQLLQLGLVSPSATSHTAGERRGRKNSVASSDDSASQTQTPRTPRQHSSQGVPRQRLMDSSIDSSSENEGVRSQSEDARAVSNGHWISGSSATDGEQTEDLFLNIAEDTTKGDTMDASVRADRLRSRIAVARSTNRQSLPSNAFSSPSPGAPNASKIPAAIDTKAGAPSRRSAAFPLASTPRAQREQSPRSPANALETSRSRFPLDLSPKPSLSNTRPNEQEHSPLYATAFSKRRPSYPDTPPSRNQAYRPSNLHYSSTGDAAETLPVDPPPDAGSRADGTESLDSTGPAASVWDELDELKSRIRRIEMGGKIPATSNAVISNASGERPRTANTSVTTASSSPQHQRKRQDQASDTTEDASRPHKVHPLLSEALGRLRPNIAPSAYRALEATVQEALELAELSGSAGPQGTLISASSIINGASIPDRQVRRKADSICRSLTELCIALNDTKSSIQSPAMRTVAAANARRPSVQSSGDSPSIRASIEPESNEPPRSSPSRAMSRIEAREARRVSLLGGGFTGSPRESSLEPPTPSQSQLPSRLARAGTSLLRTRRAAEDDEEDLTLRAPSRAMTDFREVRASNNSKRFSREYTSREPMPELQPSPALQHTTSLRRPTVSGVANENSLLYRDPARRYNMDRLSTPGYDTQPLTPHNPNRASMGSSGLSRTASLSRRVRGSGVGE